MKKFLWILILASALGFTACGNDDDDNGTVTYNIGDTGPGGGIIFYVNPNAASDGWTYLEAAPENISGTQQWSTANYSVTTGTGIGTGKSNTASIIAGGTAPAAKACVDYRGPNDLADWFLPSQDELNELWKLYDAKKTEGVSNYAGLTDDWYWSSSEDASNAAWIQWFSDSTQLGNGKSSAFSVRAVRAF